MTYGLNTPYDWNQAFGYQYNSSSASGSGKNNMVIGPELAFAGVSSLIGGIAQGFGANRQADATIQAAGIQAQAQRDAAFQNLLAGQYALTGAKQFDRFEQQKAADYQQAFLDPRKSEFGSEAFQRTVTDSLSPNAQKLRFQSNIDQLNQTLASRRAVTDAMFGPVAQNPYAYGGAPAYTQSSLL